MGEKRGREGWRKGEEWGLWGRWGCEEPEVRGDTGEMERGPRCVMVAGPPHGSTPPLTPGPPHLPILIPSHLLPPTTATTTTTREWKKKREIKEMERRKTKYLQLSRQGEKNRGKHP